MLESCILTRYKGQNGIKKVLSGYLQPAQYVYMLSYDDRNHYIRRAQGSSALIATYQQ